MSANDMTRRSILALGGAGVTAATLAACAPGGSDSGTGSGDSTDAGGGSGSGAPTEVAKVADIPVGGSIDAKNGSAPILLAQPTEGNIVCFSAICTHQQCVVAAAGDEFDCPCHGSRFDAATGEPLPGSVALKPLSALTVTVQGDAVLVS